MGGPASFLFSVGGNIEAAKAADDVYNKPDKRSDIGDHKYDKELSDMRTGVYYNPDNKQTIISYRGTNPLDFNDLLTDAAIIFGLEKHTPQFKNAISKYEQVKKKYGNNIIATGHSLGGTKVNHVAANTDLPSGYAYNPGTWASSKLNKKVKNYSVFGDPLSNISLFKGSKLKWWNPRKGNPHTINNFIGTGFADTLALLARHHVLNHFPKMINSGKIKVSDHTFPEWIEGFKNYYGQDWNQEELYGGLGKEVADELAPFKTIKFIKDIPKKGAALRFKKDSRLKSEANEPWVLYTPKKMYMFQNKTVAQDILTPEQMEQARIAVRTDSKRKLLEDKGSYLIFKGGEDPLPIHRRRRSKRTKRVQVFYVKGKGWEDFRKNL